MSFVLCPSCSRHAKTVERACPFCGAELAAAAAQGDPSIRNARSRSRLLFGAVATAVASAAVAGATVAGVAGVAAAVTGCSSSSTFAPPYGQPPHDSGTPADAGGGSGDDAGGVTPAYGAPAYGAAAIDSGSD